MQSVSVQTARGNVGTGEALRGFDGGLKRDSTAAADDWRSIALLRAWMRRMLSARCWSNAAPDSLTGFKFMAACNVLVAASSMIS